MRVVILGAGRRGLRLAQHLIEEKKSVVFIDNSSERCSAATAKLDCMAVCGSSTDIEMLREAGCDNAEAVIAVTDNDETNLVACGIIASSFRNVGMTIAAIRSINYLGTGLDSDILGISHIVNPEQEAAGKIERIIETGLFRDFEYFPYAGFMMFSRKVTKESIFDGRTIAEIRREIPGRFVVIGIRRRGKALTPSGDTVVHDGDEIAMIVDDDESSDIYSRLSDVRNVPINKIILVGGTRIARFALLSMSESRRRNVILVEKDLGVCERFARDFPEVIVLNGAISDESFWEEERLYQSDLLISVTDNDELNIIAASYAKRLGTKRAVALIKTNNSYIPLAEAMDIDGVISTTNATVDAIVRYLRGDRIQSLHTLFDGQLEVYEYEVTESFRYTGMKLKDIDFRGKLIIAGVKRAKGKDNFIPDGSYQIEVGDTLLLSAVHSNYAYVEKLLTERRA